MVRLINVPKGPGAIPVNLGVNVTDEKTISMVKALYPKACKVIVDSDHQMHQATPEVVADAIRNVLGARDGNRQPALRCS